jgi:hypothetical protein
VGKIVVQASCLLGGRVGSSGKATATKPATSPQHRNKEDASVSWCRYPFDKDHAGASNKRCSVVGGLETLYTCCFSTSTRTS